MFTELMNSEGMKVTATEANGFWGQNGIYIPPKK